MSKLNIQKADIFHIHATRNILLCRSVGELIYIFTKQNLGVASDTVRDSISDH